MYKLKAAFKKFSQVIEKEVNYYFPHPRFATLSLTERCNLKCRSCGVWKQPARIKDELDLQTIFRVLQESKELGVKKIYLVEGEPLLRVDIVEIIKKITALGMDSEITTNGTLLKKAMAQELIEVGLSSVVVSIDAPNESHDNLRGVKGTFQKATEGIRELAVAKKSAKNDKFKIFINSLITSETVGFLDGWVDFACGLGVDGINFLYPNFVPKEVDDASAINDKKISSGRFVGFDKDLIIRKESFPGMLKKLNEISQKGAARGLTIWVSPDLFLSKPENLETGQVPYKKCYLIRDSFIIGPYGDILPCSLLDEYFYGSVKEKSIRELWKNAAHRLLLDRVKKGIQMCRYCRCHFGYNMTIGQQIKRKLVAK